MKAVGKNAGILRCALNDNSAMATLLSGLGMMEGENVEIFALTLKYPQPKVARTAL